MPGDSTTGSTGLNDGAAALDHIILGVGIAIVATIVLWQFFTIARAIAADLRTKKK